MGMYEVAVQQSAINDLMSQVDDQGLLFNVSEHSLFAETHDVSAYGQEGLRLIGNKKALINTRTDEIMSVVSSSYKVVSNEEIFSNFCRAVVEAGVNIEGANAKVSQNATGSRALVEFSFPEEVIRVAGDDSDTALQICAINSFDGSLRYIVKGGALRMKCLNGQILGDILGEYSSTHTKQLDVPESAQHIMGMVQSFQHARVYWDEMLHKPVSDHQFDCVAAEFLNLKEEPKGMQLNVLLAGRWEKDPNARSNARYNHLVELWDKYRAEFGQNVYALYNALTDYVTHPHKEYKDVVNHRVRQRNALQSVTAKHPFI